MFASISVDLDEIPCYSAIHGLEPPADGSAHAVYERGVARFESWLRQLDARATFFAIGRDLDHAPARDAIARLHGAGHEIGNHTFHHRYDFTRRSAESQGDDIRRGADAIEHACGERPVGFRAPGYTIVDATFEQLTAQGYEYDSSVFPCPPYYAAKAAAIASIAARGRRSHSIVDDPRVLTAPADPYRVGTPYHRRGDGMLELPIGVTGLASARLPFIGTTVAMAGERGARWLARAMGRRPLVNLELHGIDLLDAEADGLAWLKPYQPDLKRAGQAKLAALNSAVTALLEAGYTLVTLHEAAHRLE